MNQTKQTNCTFCFIIPPHLEDQRTKDVSEEVRRRRKGALIFKNSIARKPHKLNLDDQDIFSAQHTMRLPGWKVADTEQEADQNKNKQVDNCWDNTKAVLAYYKDVLNFDLKSKLDGQVVSTIDFGDEYNNAFFNGDQMVYGNGDNVMFENFSNDISVICHELGHGVVDHTTPLEYAGMSGALNESYADIFAICFMHYSAKKSFDQLTDKDWMIGEKCTVGGGALRSFTDTPARSPDSPLGPDTDPRTMANFYAGDDDEGGVHINSGIINHVFYLFCKAVGGNTWETPLKLWFSVLSEKLIKNDCTFSEFCQAVYSKADATCKPLVKSAFGQVGLK